MTLERQRKENSPKDEPKRDVTHGEEENSTAAYRNPYDRAKDPENWKWWNVGEEDGSRNMESRHVGVTRKHGYLASVAYKHGYNTGRYRYLLTTQEFSNKRPKSSQSPESQSDV